MEQIKYIGMDKLSEQEMEIVMKFSEEHFVRLQRYISNLGGMAVHIKLHSDSGGKDRRKNYEVSLKAMAATKIYTATAEGWVLDKVMKDVCKNLERELEHMFHNK